MFAAETFALKKAQENGGPSNLGSPNVVVRLGHSHIFIDSLDNHSTASEPASCRRRRPPGNAVSRHSSTMCLVVWWLCPKGKQVMRSRPIVREIRYIWPGHISDDLE